MPKVGDVLTYSYEGYSTMMFVDEVTDIGFFYWSCRIISGTDQAEIITSRQFMADMLEPAFHWEDYDRSNAAAILIVLVNEGSERTQGMIESIKALHDKTPSAETRKELIALGMEANIVNEQRYAVAKMGEILFDKKKGASRANTSDWFS
jgi:hypothetical protein